MPQEEYSPCARFSTFASKASSLGPICSGAINLPDLLPLLMSLALRLATGIETASLWVALTVPDALSKYKSRSPQPISSITWMLMKLCLHLVTMTASLIS